MTQDSKELEARVHSMIKQVGIKGILEITDHAQSIGKQIDCDRFTTKTAVTGVVASVLGLPVLGSIMGAATFVGLWLRRKK